MPLLASQLGESFFDEKLGNLCMSWLGDPVFSIREAATINLRRLTEVFGVEWAKKTIIPRVLAMGSDQNYIYRMTTIFSINTIAQAVSAQIIKELFLPTLLKLATDPIPNIRFNVPKSLETLTPILKSDPSTASVVTNEIRAALLQLSNDQDYDVKYFTQRALVKDKESYSNRSHL
ncbi:protein phosphatase 2A structural subunit [Basidiobolus ranarum]|uniref:Protein phosphatase 2A structural subunit n=1 Tax=Basidiobolus ranarum TaxID=34480 RepID=A0ABR2VM22_9FUNG